MHHLLQFWVLVCMISQLLVGGPAQAAMVLPPLALRVIRESSTQHAVVSSQRVREAQLHACKLILKAGHVALFSPRYVWQSCPSLQGKRTDMGSPILLGSLKVFQWTMQYCPVFSNIIFECRNVAGAIQSSCVS